MILRHCREGTHKCEGRIFITQVVGSPGDNQRASITTAVEQLCLCRCHWREVSLDELQSSVPSAPTEGARD